VTVNDLRIVSILEKSMEANSSRCEKDEEIGSLRKIQGKKGKARMDDWMTRHLSPVASSESLLGFVLLTRNRALETGVIVTMIPRQTLDMEGARGIGLKLLQILELGSEMTFLMT